MEREHNMSISFLDTRVIRKPGRTTVTDWFIKPQNSGRYLHFNSNQPIHLKTNLFRAAYKRATSLSDQSFHQENTELVFKIFKNNGYPDHIINQVMNKHRIS